MKTVSPETEAVTRDLFDSWTRWDLLTKRARDLDQVAGRIRRRFWEEYAGGLPPEEWLVGNLVELALERVDWRHVALALLRALARRRRRSRGPG